MEFRVLVMDTEFKIFLCATRNWGKFTPLFDTVTPQDAFCTAERTVRAVGMLNMTILSKYSCFLKASEKIII